MGKMFEDSSSTALSEAMKIELAKQEYEQEDGKLISNLQGICQGLISRAADGDLQVINLIAELTREGKR